MISHINEEIEALAEKIFIATHATAGTNASPVYAFRRATEFVKHKMERREELGKKTRE